MTEVNGQRVVRIRRHTEDLGPFRLVRWVVTDVHGRKPLGPVHLTYERASEWVREQGWRHTGRQT